MISGLVLKYLNGECFVIRRGYETTLPVSSSFCLTVPARSKALQPDRKVWLIGSAWAIGAKLVVPLWGQGKLSLTMRPPSTV